MAKRVFGQHGVPETGLDQPLDRLGVIGFHDDSWGHPNFLEIAIDDLAQITAFRVEQEGNVGEIGGLEYSDVSTADSLVSVSQHQQFFFKERHNLEVLFRDRQGDQSKVEAAIVQSFNRLLSGIHGHTDFGLWILLSQLPERLASLINEGG